MFVRWFTVHDVFMALNNLLEVKLAEQNQPSQADT